MTQEEKAKAYDEAIERAKIWQEHLYDVNDKDYADELNYIFPELKESEDERVRKALIHFFSETENVSFEYWEGIPKSKVIAWLEKQGKNPTALPKWKYKKDNAPLLRDSLILNKYGCVAKSPSGALVSDVWVIDYDELAKLPKEEIEKQGEQKPYGQREECSDCQFNYAGECKGSCGMKQNEQKTSYTTIVKTGDGGINALVTRELPADGCDDEQKPAWSEEDEKVIHCLEYTVKHFYEDKDTVKWCCDWLKSLRPQSTWKPSEEQMDKK